MAVQRLAREQGQGQGRRRIHVPQGSGERAADVVAAAVGSWTFIIVQSVLVAVWVLVNIAGFIARWDPYPFILLNLLFSTQAAYTAPIIMMSQNRQATKDRLRDDHEAAEVSLLYTINQQQLAILRLLHAQICPGTQLPSVAAATATPDAPADGGATT